MSKPERVRTGRNRRFDDDDVARMYERYQTGLTLEEVAAEFGTGIQTVHGEFLRRGFPRRPGGKRTRPVVTEKQGGEAEQSAQSAQSAAEGR